MKATTLATQPAQRTKGQWTGHYAARVIDWLLGSWFKVIVAGCGLSMAYSASVFVHRFLAFTWYVFQRLEQTGTLS